ncbi:hypothetical protein V9K67_27035 [Paraflavisolibacter sp. H34]|uniref:hypothetical protein n=1 Tax=Huijunlia imazamoxiresistens TaxID=3127457 RepID=UPI00301AED2B
MNGIGFILMLLFVFIGLPATVGLLVYFIPKKLGYPKVAKWLTWTYIVFVGFIAITTIFEDELFSKSDAKKLIKEQNIDLTEDFTLNENESMWAIGDFYHTFTLTISENDKRQIINSIKSDPFFKKSPDSVVDYLFNPSINRYEGPRVTQNYEDEDSYFRELFQPNGKGYAPTFRRIRISKADNTLTFEDIDD